MKREQAIEIQKELQRTRIEDADQKTKYLKWVVIGGFIVYIYKVKPLDYEYSNSHVWQLEKSV